MNLQNKDWEYIPLCDAVEIHDNLRIPVNGKERASRINGKDISELYPYYGATGQVGFIDESTVNGEYVLLGEDGAPFLNASAQKAYIVSGKFWVNNHAHVLRSKTNNKFLCYYLNNFDYRGYVSGTTRLKLTQRQMKLIPIPVPANVEQDRIVSCIEELFSKLDKGVETLQTTKQQLAVYRQAVLKETFSNVLGKKTLIKDVCNAIKVGIVIKPTQYYVQTGGVFAFRNSNVRRGCIEDKDWVMISKSGHHANSRSEVHAGDVLISRSGVNLGMAAVVPERFDGYNAIDVIIAVPEQTKLLPEYLVHYTNSPYGQEIVKERERGAAQAHLNVKVYGNLSISIPTMEVQKEVVTKIEKQLSLCDNIEQTVDEALAQADAMRQSILRQAFEGGII